VFEFAEGRHPLCHCHETTFSGGPSAAEVEACRERSGGITHPVLTSEDIAAARQSIAVHVLLEEDQIATRPQDWASQARVILQERGAWRSS
jgi:hypothetical protein